MTITKIIAFASVFCVFATNGVFAQNEIEVEEAGFTFQGRSCGEGCIKEALTHPNLAVAFMGPKAFAGLVSEAISSALHQLYQPFQNKEGCLLENILEFMLTSEHANNFKSGQMDTIADALEALIDHGMLSPKSLLGCLAYDIILTHSYFDVENGKISVGDPDQKKHQKTWLRDHVASNVKHPSNLKYFLAYKNGLLVAKAILHDIYVHNASGSESCIAFLDAKK